MLNEPLENIIRRILESGFLDKRIFVWYDDGGTVETALRKAIPEGVEPVFFQGSYLRIRSIIEREDPDLECKWLIYIPDKPRERSWLKDYELLGLRYDATIGQILPNKLGLKPNARVTALLSGDGGRLLTENWNRFIEGAEVPLTPNSVEEALLAAIFEMPHGFDVKTAILMYLSDPKYLEKLNDYGIFPEFDQRSKKAIWGTSGDPLEDDSRTDDREHLAAALLLTEFVERCNGLCEKEFEHIIPKKERRSAIISIVDAWTQNTSLNNAFFDWADKIQSKYAIAERIQGQLSIVNCVSFRAIDDALLKDLIRRIGLEGADKVAPYMELSAKIRKETVWARNNKVLFWNQIQDAAILLRSITDAQQEIENDTWSADDLIKHYIADDGWWVIDHAFLSMIAFEPSTSPEVQDRIMGPASRYYANWLRQLGTSFSEAVARSKSWNSHVIESQGAFFEHTTPASNETVGFLFIDALRYDLAQRLMKKLTDEGYEVTARPLLSSLPSTTEVGMGALLPKQANELRLSVSKGKIKVELGKDEITTRAQRKGWIKAVFPAAAFLNINEITQKTALQLHDIIENASHVFVLDHEVDKMGTFAPTEISAGAFLRLVDRIAKAIESLHQAGVHKVIVGTDHGFIVMPPELRRDAPLKDFQGDENTFKSWRFIVGKPRDDPTLVSFDYEDLGLGSGGTARFPRSTHIFALPGTQDFFHGGISLQENCLLSITSMHKSTNLELVKVRVEIPGLVNPQDITIRLKPDYRVSSSPRRLIIEVREADTLLYRTLEQVLAESKSIHIMLPETPQSLKIKVFDADTYEILFNETRKTLSRGYEDDFL